MTDKTEKMPEYLKAFFDQATPPNGQGNDYFELNWSILLMFVPYLVYFLSFYENKYIFWGLHVYSLIMIVLYSMLISKFKEKMAYISNPFDFVKFELINFINVIVFFGFSFFFISMVVGGQFNKEGISLFDFIYYSFVTVATLGYGDIHPVGWYGKLLAITELCFGIWFVITVLPVAVADQAERLRDFRMKKQKLDYELKKAIESGEIKREKLDV